MKEIPRTKSPEPNNKDKKKSMNITISYSDADKQRCRSAKCYVTQYTPEEIQDLIKFENDDKEK